MRWLLSSISIAKFAQMVKLSDNVAVNTALVIDWKLFGKKSNQWHLKIWIRRKVAMHLSRSSKMFWCTVSLPCKMYFSVPNTERRFMGKLVLPLEAEKCTPRRIGTKVQKRELKWVSVHLRMCVAVSLYPQPILVHVRVHKLIDGARTSQYGFHVINAVYQWVCIRGM